MISSRGNQLMKGPSMRSVVAATAMPRTRDARFEKNFSRPSPPGSSSRLNAGLSPLAMTGLAGPISSTSVFSAAIMHSLSHQHRYGLLDHALEGRQQLGANGAVDNAVVARKCHRHDADKDN